MHPVPSLAATVTSLSLLSLPVAPALAQLTSVDQAYLSSLLELLETENPDAYRLAAEEMTAAQHIEYGQVICQGLDAGMSLETLVTAFWEGVLASPEAQYLTASELEALAFYSGAAIPISTYYYCEEHVPAVLEWIGE